MIAPKVLFVGNDVTSQELLGQVLEREGMRVETVAGGGEALRRCLGGEGVEPDLVLLSLDLTLLGMDGIALCRALRARSNVPIIMIGAQDETSVVVCLEVGADDYLSKPYSARELISRVRAHLRRQRRKPRAPEHKLLEFPGLRIDLLRHRVWTQGTLVELTAAQFRVLTLLASHPGLVYSREKIMEPIWGSEFSGGSRAADVHIQNIRQKIELDPTNPRYIQTVRGVGYKFAEL